MVNAQFRSHWAKQYQCLGIFRKLDFKTKADFPVCILSIVIVWAPKAEVGIGP